MSNPNKMSFSNWKYLPTCKNAYDTHDKDQKEYKPNINDDWSGNIMSFL